MLRWGGRSACEGWTFLTWKRDSLPQLDAAGARRLSSVRIGRFFHRWNLNSLAQLDADASELAYV